ncbi:MAG: hypothetical protein QNJ47_14760 [Nostocaceae cyanobacterium]|nr:hypothetical protein [Nostocaceae cyanobacterium]
MPVVIVFLYGMVIFSPDESELNYRQIGQNISAQATLWRCQSSGS